MYKIGEFSRITGLSVKALRFYDEEGILEPSTIKENGYRFYDDNNYEIAKRIILLKKLHFSIAEIKDVLQNANDNDDLQDYLIEKRKQIEDHILLEKNYLSMIDQYLSLKESNENKQHEIGFKDVEELLVLSYRFQGAYPDMGKYSPKLYKLAKNKTNGHILTQYHDEGYKEIADIEVCLPIKERVPIKDAQIKTLPSVHVITTTHIGCYDNLGDTYKVLLDYAKEHQFVLLGPSREVYIKGPGMIMKGNPDKYITEIQIPIQKG